MEQFFLIDDLFNRFMRLLAAADIHGSQYRLNMILKNIETYAPHLIIICGDITQFGPGEVATNFLNQIPRDTVAIAGNIDSADVNQSITKSKADNIHLKQIEKKGLLFVGVGGLLPSPLPKIQVKGKTQKPLDEIIKNETILVTHEPPFKTKDKVFFGHHAGNHELRELVERCQPKLVLCGHIHEDPGYMTLGETIVVNCSIGKKTEGALIEIDEDITVKTLD
jgi:hypothetical protein